MCPTSELPLASASTADDALAPRATSAPPTRRPADDPVDRDLAALLAVRDHRRALALAMQQLGDAVYHYCRRMVGDDHAPDLQQLVFVDVYRGFSTFDGRASVRAWVFAIARHRCIDALRSRARQRTREAADDEQPDELADDGPDPHALLELRDRAALLRGCIDRLAPAARSAVLLRYQEGLAYEAMSAMSGEAAGTIGRRVARALVALRACVERDLGAQR